MNNHHASVQRERDDGGEGGKCFIDFLNLHYKHVSSLRKYFFFRKNYLEIHKKNSAAHYSIA
jgi:hypothetical protein